MALARDSHDVTELGQRHARERSKDYARPSVPIGT
jgi:hypothetical protein